MMIMWTILLTLTCTSKLTRILFIVQRMIFTLFPAMTFCANCIVWTTIHIIYNKVRTFPVWTLYGLIRKYMWFSSVVLPIMSVDACSLVMGRQVERAPLGLKVEYVKIIIPIKIMNKLYSNILLTMRKGAEGPILTLVHIIGVERTEFGLVLVRFVELLNAVVGLLTVVTVGAYLLSFFCVFA